MIKIHKSSSINLTILLHNKNFNTKITGEKAKRELEVGQDKELLLFGHEPFFIFYGIKNFLIFSS